MNNRFFDGINKTAKKWLRFFANFIKPKIKKIAQELRFVIRFADWRWTGFSAQKLVRRTELSATTKLSSGDETPPIANVLLAAALLVCRGFRCLWCGWTDTLFAKFWIVGRLVGLGNVCGCITLAFLLVNVFFYCFYFFFCQVVKLVN